MRDTQIGTAWWVEWQNGADCVVDKMEGADTRDLMQVKDRGGFGPIGRQRNGRGLAEVGFGRRFKGTV